MSLDRPSDTDEIDTGLAGTFVGLDTVSANHPDAQAADALQDELGEGPSHTALHRDGVGACLHRTADPESPWPTFGKRCAEELGLHAVLSTGMFPGGEPPRFRALNFWSRSP